MSRILSLALILALPLSAFGNVDGVWQCNVTSKITTKANGRTTKGKDFGSSTQTLFPDGTYTSRTPVSPLEATGTYTLKKRTVTYDPNFEDLIAIAEYSCAQAGSKCVVSAISGKTKSTVNKAFTTMKGQGTLNMSILVNGSVLVRTTSQATSNCVRR
jgi:hypothetical protein